MPQIYRVMIKNADKPLIGNRALMLGVRLPPSQGIIDIVPDNAGFVKPGTGGMSVSPDIGSLPKRLLPPGWLSPGDKSMSRSGNNTAVFSHGIGAFVVSRIGFNLRLVPDSMSHGLIEPSTIMSVETFCNALGNTVEDWQIVFPQEIIVETDGTK